ncbi:MAG: hypothetical protein K6G85_00165 [Eubacterium sp.]|nr:hypothetical protein [Eubacterium sp.]
MAEEKATIPHEVLVNYETVKVGVYATRNGKVYATTPVEIEIDEGIIVGANADPGEYENIYVQVLARLEDMLDVLSYQTSDVPEWEFDEDTGQGIWYVTHISHKKIRVVAMGAAVIIKIQRPDQEDVVLSYADFEPKSFYSEEGFTVRYYKVTASTTEPTIILYDYITKMKLANIILDHDVTARELLDELWEYLNAVYMPVDRTVVGCPVRNNITAQQIWYALTYHDMLPITKAEAAVDKYGLVKLAGGSETGNWRNRTNDEVGTIFNIAYAITSGAWSDNEMSDQSNNIVKNSVIKAYVDAVRNDKQNRIQLVRPSDIGQNGRIDNSNYQLDIYDIFSTTLTDLWIVQSKSSDSAIVWADKIASTNGTSIAENSYTKSEVNALIGALEKLTKRKVQELPVRGEDNVIYLVPKTGETDDVYDEWMWIDNQWEHFGNTQIDLSGYVPTSRMLGRISLSSNVSASSFANAIITAIVEDSGSYMSSLINRLDDFFQLKENGKGLSTNDYTTQDKNKLAGINMDTLPQLWFNNGSTPPANPEVFEGLKPGDLCYCYYTIYNAFVGVYICTAISIDNITWTPIAKPGKGLSSNDFTDELKNKLEGIDLTNYVTNTDYAQNNGQKGGVVKLSSGLYGIKNIENGIIGIVKPTDAEIEAQTSGWRVITPAQLSKAVKEGVTNNSITLTDAEKKAARDWIGADGQNGEWGKLVDKTLSADGKIALDFSDFDFGGKYKKIRIQIRGTMDVNNSNISFYRANISTAYGICTNMGKTAETLYEFELEEKPFLRMDLIRESTMTFRSISASNNLQQTAGMIPIAQKMSETYELKINSNNNFLAGTRVVVWGMK